VDLANEPKKNPVLRRWPGVEQLAWVAMPWDVFISHATEDKQDVAAPLAGALKAAGLSVWYDEFELKIGDSLRRSIDEGLSKSRFGVVVLSKAFFAKEWPQKELDGLVGREVNGKKVILPVWFDVSADEVREHSPLLADRIAAKWSDGLGKVVSEIVSVVNGEPALRPQETQEVVAEPTTSSSGSLVLLMKDDGYLLIGSRKIDVGEEAVFEVVPENPRESGFLEGLARGHSDRVGVAYSNTAFLARLEDVRHVVEDGNEIWRLKLRPEDTDYGAGTMEVSVESYSADEIAAMRARRILLNDPAPQAPSRIDDSMLEMFIQGMSTPLRVERSPLPSLYREWKQDPSTFLPLARLTVIMWLRLSGAIERVLHLDMRLENGELAVDFEGARRKSYTNVEPYVVRVTGSLPLDRAE
jgi:hypothetical protein